MLKNIGYGFGFAVLFLLSNVAEIVRNTGTTVFHSQLAHRSQWIALLLDCLLLTLAIALIVQIGSRKPYWRRLRISLIVLLPMLVLLGNRLLLANLWYKALRATNFSFWMRSGMANLMFPVPYWVLGIIGLVWLMVVLYLNARSDLARRALFAAGKIALLSGVIMGVHVTINVARAAVRRGVETNLAPMHDRDAEQQAAHPRLVWVIMDELSYAQAFEHRVPDLQMPNFDALRAQSTLYTHAQPVAYWTDLAITSLLSGEIFDTEKDSYGGKISYRNSDTEQWHPWDPANTVIGDAEKAQWNVSMAGWWNPYCTLYAGMVQRCFWSSASPYSPMRSYYSVPRNMQTILSYRLHVWNQPPSLKMRMDENYLLLDKGLGDIRDDRMDFVFVHLPVPHYPFVFDRHTKQDDASSGHSYQDGLALADKFLGQLMSALQQSPRWEKTTLILDGDHSWRSNMWVTEAGWTAEDEITSRGKFDDRPVMIVHAPGQTSPVMVDAPTPLLRLHNIAESVIANGKPTLP